MGILITLVTFHLSLSAPSTKTLTQTSFVLVWLLTTKHLLSDSNRETSFATGNDCDGSNNPQSRFSGWCVLNYHVRASDSTRGSDAPSLCSLVVEPSASIHNLLSQLSNPTCSQTLYRFRFAILLGMDRLSVLLRVSSPSNQSSSRNN